MQVIATARGYHGSLREPGDTFEVPDGAKATWFAPVEKAASAKPTRPQAKTKAQDDAEKGDDLV